MTRDELIARWIPALIGLADFLESLKAQYPDIAPMVDPKIEALRANADAGLLGGVAGVALEELRKLADTKSLDPRPHPSDLAS